MGADVGGCAQWPLANARPLAAGQGLGIDARCWAQSCCEALGLIRSERQANGLSLGEIAEVLPRYRSGSLPPQEMTAALRKIQEIDEQIAAKSRLQQMLTGPIAWFKNRKRTAP